MAEQHKYVRKTGSDSNGGTSWADAWLTIQHAADNTNPANGTPAYIHVAAGTYVEQVDIDTYAGTNDSNRIIYDGDVENESGDGASRPIINGTGTLRAGFYINNKSWITIQDSEVKNQHRTNDWAMGIYATIDSEQVAGWNFFRNLVHDVTGFWPRGVFISNDSNTKFVNNIIYDIHQTTTGGHSVGLFITALGSYYNNTIFHTYRDAGLTSTDSAGIQVYVLPTFPEGYRKLYIKNNIIHDCLQHQIHIIDNSGATEAFEMNYNDLYKDGQTYCGNWKGTQCSALSNWQTASSQDANSQEGDPLYVNEAGKDFHITDNDSPCYQAGIDLSAIFTDDYDKDTRVHWDIGADYIPTEEAPPTGLVKMVQIM